MSLSKRNRLSLLTLVMGALVWQVTVPTAHAALLFESATTLHTGSFGNSANGIASDSGFYSGVDFFISTPVHVDDIGGNFMQSGSGNGEIFGAIVAVNGQNAVPNPTDLSANVLGATLITLPGFGVSENGSGALSLDLSPGWYVEIFGSGRFGATGGGTAIINWQNGPANTGLVPTYTLRQSDGIEIIQAAGARYFVEGTVPEPAAAALLIACAGLCVRQAKWHRENS